MRHESIETTLRYYVGQDAEATADAVWAACERIGTLVGTSGFSTENENRQDAVSVTATTDIT